ncbi:MAG: FliO/MopB family protein [Candidatus Riflebacteria bacterium]|nr:FliO/MopB family protein [Candidatus Riflebacteria bacterium]
MTAKKNILLQVSLIFFSLIFFLPVFAQEPQSVGVAEYISDEASDSYAPDSSVVSANQVSIANPEQLTPKLSPKPQIYVDPDGDKPLFKSDRVAIATDSSKTQEGMQVLNLALNLFIGLFAVILLALGISYWLQKGKVFSGSGHGKVISVIPLNTKNCFLYITEVLGRVFILGVTDTNVNLIAEITDKFTLDMLKLENGQSLGGAARLFPFLNRADDTAAEETPETAETTPDIVPPSEEQQNI